MSVQDPPAVIAFSPVGATKQRHGGSTDAKSRSHRRSRVHRLARRRRAARRRARRHDRRFDGRRGHGWPRVRGGRGASCTASRSPTTWPAAAASRAPTSSSTPRRTSARPASCVTRARSARTSSRTTQQVVEECVEHDIALVSFSSAEVYGRSGLLQESDDLVVPTHYNVRLEYAIAKTLTEAVTINSRHRGLRGLRDPPVQRRRPAPVARRRLRDADLRAAGARRPPADRLRRRRAAARVPVRRSTSRASSPSTSTPRSSPSARSSTSATRTTPRRCGTSPSGSSSGSAARSPIEHADARLIHGPLYEEAESFQKLPVLDAAAAVGWAPRIDARRADRRDRALLPRPRRRARRRRRAARRGCSRLACRNPPSSSLRTRTTRRWAAPA